MTENINKSISEVLPDFFSDKLIAEFLHIFESSLKIKADTKAFQQKSPLDFQIEEGLSYRSQIDLFVTFDDNKIDKE